MQEKQLDLLKDLFGHSHESVLLTDFQFRLLWHNHEKLPTLLEGTSCAAVFNAEGRAALESGVYETRLGGETYQFRLLRYPDPDDPDSGLYVIQLQEEDVIFSFIHCRAIREYLENQSGTIRQAVTGISSASGMLNKLLEQQECRGGQEYLNITMGNCYRLLRSILNVSELIRYEEGAAAPRRIDLGRAMSDFAEACTSLLGSRVLFSYDVEEGLFIAADLDRLTGCLLSMLLLTQAGRTDQNHLIFSAKRIGESVSIQVNSESLGEDMPRSHALSHVEPLYADNELDSEACIVRRFCQTYQGTLYVTESAEGKCYSLRLPVAEEGELECRSAAKEYASNPFSRYHIALSALTEIPFY